MIVVDSSVWIDLFHGRSTAVVEQLRALPSPQEIIVGDVIMLEVLRGARSDSHAASLRRYFGAFMHARMLTDRLIDEAARTYRLLRSRGSTIQKVPDLIIGTFCLAENHDLLTKDRDFRPFADHLGLRLL
jgi:predicted nucleic acid-binding protein